MKNQELGDNQELQESSRIPIIPREYLELCLGGGGKAFWAAIAIRS